MTNDAKAKRADMSSESVSPLVPNKDSSAYRAAIAIARYRHGPGLDMGGAHNPRPAEWRLAKQLTRGTLMDLNRRINTIIEREGRQPTYDEVSDLVDQMLQETI